MGCVQNPPTPQHISKNGDLTHGNVQLNLHVGERRRRRCCKASARRTSLRSTARTRKSGPINARRRSQSLPRSVTTGRSSCSAARPKLPGSNKPSARWLWSSSSTRTRSYPTFAAAAASS